MAMKIIRLAGVTGAAAAAKRRKPTDSRKGSASVAELERRKWRRVFMM
jgi:hypothetical protein